MEQLAGTDFDFRLVGGPEFIGREFAGKYRFVQYLGPLSDSQLREEARTWCCFVHPIFQPARGCSTKLAIALGWGLPIVTTSDGIRGYIWNDSLVKVACNVSELAAMVLERSKLSGFEAHRLQSLKLLDLQPTVDEIGRRTKAFLLALH
jgi:hypothetical protein